MYITEQLIKECIALAKLPYQFDPFLMSQPEVGGDYLFRFFLHHLIKNWTKDKKVIVEVGILHGVTTAFMADAASPQDRIIGVDIEIQPNIKNIQVKYPNIEIYHSDSVAFAKSGKVSGIDLLFLDGSHELQRTRDEFENYLPLLNKDAIICVDDILLWQMPIFWNEVKAKYKTIDALDLHTQFSVGFGIILP